MRDYRMDLDTDEYLEFHKQPSEVLKLCKDSLLDDYNRCMLLGEDLDDENFRITAFHKNDRVFILNMPYYDKYNIMLFMDGLFFIDSFCLDVKEYERVKLSTNITSVADLGTYKVNGMFNFGNIKVTGKNVYYMPGFLHMLENTYLLKNARYLGFYTTLKVYTLRSLVLTVKFGHICDLVLSVSELDNIFFNWMEKNVESIGTLTVEGRGFSTLQRNQIENLYKLAVAKNISAVNINLLNTRYSFYGKDEMVEMNNLLGVIT